MRAGPIAKTSHLLVGRKPTLDDPDAGLGLSRNPAGLDASLVAFDTILHRAPSLCGTHGVTWLAAGVLLHQLKGSYLSFLQTRRGRVLHPARLQTACAMLRKRLLRTCCGPVDGPRLVGKSLCASGMCRGDEGSEEQQDG